MRNLNNCKIGILGLGYLGSNLKKFFESLNQNIEIIEIRKDNLEDIKLHVFDYFINCAGNSGDFRENLLETVESNVSLNIFLLKNLKVTFVYVYLSTSRAYGFCENKDLIFDETYIYTKSNITLDFIYDGSKLLTESLLLNYTKNINYHIAVLRVTNVYGNFNSLDDSTLIKKMIRCYLENKDITIPQNIYSTKNYIYIEDFMNAIKEVFLNLETSELFNLGSDENLSIEYICKKLNLNAKFSKDDLFIANISSEKFKHYFPNWSISNNFVEYTKKLKRQING